MNLKNRQVHPYHIVDYSPWPILMSLSVFIFAVYLVNFFSRSASALELLFPLILIIIIGIQWFRDIIREGQGGFHTKKVQRSLYIGFVIFLLSEIMLFISFFWAYFNNSLSPSIEIGSIWPPVGITAINPWGLPFLGACVLLGSGFVLTLAHHAFLYGNKQLTLNSMYLTILLGMLFLVIQYNEYTYGEFTIADSAFGSVFYMTTGLHALHVIIGVIFLIIATIRIYKDDMTTEHHLNFECSIIYWHLVDFIWILVFLIYYWWGG